MDDFTQTMLIVPTKVHKRLIQLQEEFNHNQIPFEEFQAKWAETIGRYLPQDSHEKDYFVVDENDPSLKTLH